MVVTAIANVAAVRNGSDGAAISEIEAGTVGGAAVGNVSDGAINGVVVSSEI